MGTYILHAYTYSQVLQYTYIVPTVHLFLLPVCKNHVLRYTFQGSPGIYVCYILYQF